MAQTPALKSIMKSLYGWILVVLTLGFSVALLLAPQVTLAVRHAKISSWWLFLVPTLLFLVMLIALMPRITPWSHQSTVLALTKIFFAAFVVGLSYSASLREYNFSLLSIAHQKKIDVLENFHHACPTFISRVWPHFVFGFHFEDDFTLFKVDFARNIWNIAKKSTLKRAKLDQNGAENKMRTHPSHHNFLAMLREGLIDKEHQVGQARLLNNKDEIGIELSLSTEGLLKTQRFGLNSSNTIERFSP